MCSALAEMRWRVEAKHLSTATLDVRQWLGQGAVAKLQSPAYELKVRCDRWRG